MHGVTNMDLWHRFKLAELTEVMRQKDDSISIHLLNEIRVGIIEENVESLLYSHFITPDDPLYSTEALDMIPVNEHNVTMLNKLQAAEFLKLK